jgi:hypothetical protein
MVGEVEHLRCVRSERTHAALTPMSAMCTLYDSTIQSVEKDLASFGKAEARRILDKIEPEVTHKDDNSVDI